MMSFKEDGPHYNWEHSKVESVSDFLGIDIKTFYCGEFQFYQTGLIRKVLEYTGMEHCNGFPTPTKVGAPLGTDDNGSEAKIDCPNSYASVIGIMFIWHKTQDYISPLMFTSMASLHTTPRHHMKLM